MGGHDAELILVAGALLAAGIVGALLADRVRIPGLLLFLGAGDARRLRGDRRDRVRRRRAGPHAGHDRADPDPLRGRADAPAGRRSARCSAPRPRWRPWAPSSPPSSPGLAAHVDLRPQPPRRDAGRRRDRRHRLGGDLRRAAPLDPGEAAGALAGGRVGDERPGRAAARDRLHRMDPGARLRARRHGRPARAEAGDRRGDRAGARAGARSRPRAGCGCPPTASTRSPRSRSPGSPSAWPRSPTAPASSPST